MRYVDELKAISQQPFVQLWKEEKRSLIECSNDNSNTQNDK